MTHRILTSYHLTETAAKAAEGAALAARSPDSEIYSRGVMPCMVQLPATGAIVEGFKLEMETYSG